MMNNRINFIENIIHLNNEGVSKVLAGQEKAGISQLNDALKMIDRALRTCQLWNESHPKGLLQSEGSCHMVFPEKRYSIHSIVPLPGLRKFEDDSFFIYNGLFLLSTTTPPFVQNIAHGVANSEKEDSSSVEEEFLFLVFSGCIIMNIALTYHKFAQFHRGKQVYAEKAERMYQLLSKLCEEMRTLMNEYPSKLRCMGGIAMLLFIAAVNNLSLLRHEKGKFEAAKGGFEKMVEILFSDAAGLYFGPSRLHSVDDTDEDTLPRSTIRREEVLEFILNVMCSRASKVAPAA